MPTYRPLTRIASSWVSSVRKLYGSSRGESKDDSKQESKGNGVSGVSIDRYKAKRYNQLDDEAVSLENLTDVHDGGVGARHDGNYAYAPPSKGSVTRMTEVV